MAEKEL